MGFWDHPTKGISTPSKQWMAELLEAQNAGQDTTKPERLRLDAAEIKPHPTQTYPGHTAWLDHPWKLHRIQDKTGNVKIELYNLADGPMETSDLSAEQNDRTTQMQKALESWLDTVIASLNGEDY
jgi:hypothetical protein